MVLSESVSCTGKSTFPTRGAPRRTGSGPSCASRSTEGATPPAQYHLHRRVYMDVILIAGLWLRATVWNETADELTALGHRPLKLKLPGADDDSREATLEDQVGAVLQAVDGLDKPVLVGHSAAATLAWIAAD